jgi:hypothetical protein
MEMSEILRDKIDRAVDDFIRTWVAPNLQAHLLDDDDNDGERFRQRLANLVGPELDRLRAEVERLRMGAPGSVVRGHVEWLTNRAESAEAERDDLRAEVERLRRRESIAIDQRDAALRRAESAGIRERDERRARDRALARRDDLRARLAKVEALRDEWDAAPNPAPVLRSLRSALRTALASVPEPSDEDRHGSWDKELQRYEDGCRQDRPHEPSDSEPAPDADRECCDLCGVSEATGWHDGHCDTCCRRDGHSPDADREAGER